VSDRWIALRGSKLAFSCMGRGSSQLANTATDTQELDNLGPAFAAGKRSETNVSHGVFLLGDSELKGALAGSPPFL
jgi:hypothetical protein